MNKKWVILLAILLIPVANAIDSTYNIIVEENGNSLVIIELDGSGLVNIPLQEDVADIRIKGALYTQENNSIDVSIGSTEKAVILYKTSMLTEKKQGDWNFKINLPYTYKEKVTVALPKETVVIETNPNALIESIDYTKLIWQGHLNNIEFTYKFPEIEVITFEDIEEKEITNKTNYSSIFFMIILSIILIAFIAFIIIRLTKKPKKSNKHNIVKTLSKNESLIVNIIMQHKGSLKRNQLEKISKLAKSSLANTLNNLERKNIIELDKTYTTHFVKFTRWFNEL